MAISSDPKTINVPQTPIKDPISPLDEAKKYAEEVRLRRGDIRPMETKLQYYGDKPGWTRRWCNDEGDNIPRRLADGWRFVAPKDVRLSDSVGFGSAGVGDRVTYPTRIGTDAIQVYLMEIPTEIVEEILEVRSYAQVRKITESIENGSIGVTSGKTYNPGEERDSKYYGNRNSVTTGVKS